MPRYVTCAMPGTRCFAAAVPEGLGVQVGADCVVQMGGGPEFCRIRLVLDDAAGGSPVGQVLRLATVEDQTRERTNHALAEEAIHLFDTEVAAAPQGVHAVSARFNLDRSRLVLVYHADQRFDARRAAASLNRRYRSVVEAHQIGIRDETATLGGIGSCGRAVCCATWLHAFRPVNVRMAKAQKLSLNPAAINGCCGRLKCCLCYELAPPEAAAAGEGNEEGDT